MDDFGVMPFMETSWNFHMVYGCFYKCEMKHPRWLDISLNHLKSLKSPRSWLRRGGMKFGEIHIWCGWNRWHQATFLMGKLFHFYLLSYISKFKYPFSLSWTPLSLTFQHIQNSWKPWRLCQFDLRTFGSTWRTATPEPDTGPALSTPRLRNQRLLGLAQRWPREQLAASPNAADFQVGRFWPMMGRARDQRCVYIYIFIIYKYNINIYIYYCNIYIYIYYIL